MQNRFTVKDFFYVVIGLVICLLLFLNMVKTNREIEALNRVQRASGRPEADLYPNWHTSQADNRGSNDVGFIQQAADRLIEEARRALDYEKRPATVADLRA